MGIIFPTRRGGNAVRNSGGPSGRIELDEFIAMDARYAGTGVN